MIVGMNKFSFLVFHAEYEQFLQDIREIGVLHVIQKQQGDADDALQAKLQKLTQIQLLIKTLNSKLGEKKAKIAARLYNMESVQETLNGFTKKKEQLNSEAQQCSKEAQALEPWGDFDPQQLETLKEAGYSVAFFSCSVASFKPEWVEQDDIIEINRVGTTVYFIGVKPVGVAWEIDADPLTLPQTTTQQLSAQRAKIESQLEQTEQKIVELAINSVNDLVEEQKILSTDIEFSKVLLNTTPAAESRLMLLEGWVPETNEEALIAYLEDKNLFFEKLSATEEEQPPVLLKNNKFSKLYEPITKIFSLPNYHEMDMTPFLAPFFMMFFGFCTGDAGYGLLIVLAATLLKRKMSDSAKAIASLAQWLGFAAVIFGSLSGTFFGIELAKIEALASVKNFFLDMNNLMVLSVALGAVQVLFGMFLNVANITRRRGFKYAMSKIGWITILLAGGCVIGLPMLEIVLPVWLTYILYGCMGLGAALAYLYNSPGKNIFVNFGLGLWDTYNMATGVVGDLLSYIRLFALGLTGGILGGVFNKLAIDLSPDIPVAGFLVTVVILLIGHSITLVLTILGACIHPMRLTFVEFYKNVGFEGGGKEYKPFKQK